jgi:hypothetical protein
MFGFDGRLIEALVLLQSVELIGDEREMRVELLICCVLEERSREGDTVVETVEISFQLFALLGQSIEFLFGLVFELLKESLFVLFDVTPNPKPQTPNPKPQTPNPLNYFKIFLSL